MFVDLILLEKYDKKIDKDDFGVVVCYDFKSHLPYNFYFKCTNKADIVDKLDRFVSAYFMKQVNDLLYIKDNGKLGLNLPKDI